ncbi:MAG: hypothetical protein WC284_17360 [Candidimonas sp.]
MKISELRRNPSKNIRETIYEFFNKYRNDENAYVHTTNIDKVGINPKKYDSHDSPVGIYAFRIMDIADSIDRIRPDTKSLGLILPYYGGNYTFILSSPIPHDFVKIYTNELLNSDIEKMKDMFSLSENDIKKLKSSARTNLNFIDAPAGYLWGMTKSIAGGFVDEFDNYTSVDTRKWSTILRKLGHEAFNDPGYGFIHGAESTQALFLNTSTFNVIDRLIVTERRKIELDIGYVDRIPKHLHMKTIPNTFFYNNEKEMFSNIRSWTVDYMSINDYNRWSRWLPWNAEGRIGHLSVPSSVSFNATRDTIKELKNIKNQNVIIDELSLGINEPYEIYQIVKSLNPNIPVNKITYGTRFNEPIKIDDIDDNIAKKIIHKKL